MRACPVRRALVSRAFAGTVLACCAASAWPAYRLDDISGGGVFQRTSAINNAGTVTGFTELGGGSFIWNAATGLQRIGEPALPGHTPTPSYNNTFALDINERGDVAGTWGLPASGDIRGFLHTQAGGSQDLGLPGLRVNDITDGGRLLGTVWGGNLPHYVTIEPDGTVTEFAPPLTLQSAIGLRNDGLVVATRYDDAGTFRSSAGLIDGDAWVGLPSLGEYRSQAVAFNEQGAIVGMLGFDVPQAGVVVEHAFAYTPERGTVDLAGMMSGVIRYSSATAINEHGIVVGYGARGDGWDTFSFIHDLSTGRFVDMARAFVPGTDHGWSNMIFTDINDEGQIAGYGLYGNQLRAFMLTPDGPLAPPVPEPGTALLFVAGVAMLASARRKL